MDTIVLFRDCISGEVCIIPVITYIFNYRPEKEKSPEIRVKGHAQKPFINEVRRKL